MPKNPWFHTASAAWSLAMEASSVIALRTMKAAAGGRAAELEAGRMISEKIEAAVDLQTMVLTGRLGHSPISAANKTLALYRRKVRANRRRLTKA